MKYGARLHQLRIAKSSAYIGFTRKLDYHRGILLISKEINISRHLKLCNAFLLQWIFHSLSSLTKMVKFFTLVNVRKIWY